MTEQKVVDLKECEIWQGKNLILEKVTFQIQETDFVYLTGKTGSGKSSLMRTLYADQKLQKGIGRVAGFSLENISNFEIPFLRRKIGIIFQDFQLLTDRTIYKNLDFVLRATGWKREPEIRTRIEQVLSLVGLSTRHFKMPHELSGGEQQRICVARALLNHPEVVLADEPTGNLDPDTTDEILELLHNISVEGTAVLMATHDYRIISKYKGRKLHCAAGSIVEE